MSATALPGTSFGLERAWAATGNPALTTTRIINPTYGKTDITATFVKTTYTLTIAGGSGSGCALATQRHDLRIRRAPAGERHGAAGLRVYGLERAWAGNLENAALATTRIINPTYGNTDITATFAKTTYTLTIAGGTGVDALSPPSGTSYELTSTCR